MQEYVKVCYEFIDPIIADTLAKKHKQRRLELDAKDGVKERNALGESRELYRKS